MGDLSTYAQLRCKYNLYVYDDKLMFESVTNKVYLSICELITESSSLLILTSTSSYLNEV